MCYGPVVIQRIINMHHGRTMGRVGILGTDTVRRVSIEKLSTGGR